MRRFLATILFVAFSSTLLLQGCARYVCAYCVSDVVPTPVAYNHNDTVLTVATFNAGILYGYIWGRKFFEPTPYSDKRLELLPQYIRAYDLDVIGFQELYRTEDKLYLINELKDVFPYAVYFQKENDFPFGLHNGELFLSKLPILESSFNMFHRNVITEKMAADKGLLSIVVSFNGKRVAITNVHTTVGGGFRDTESPKTNAIRNRQLWQTLNTTARYGANANIILGDFNAGPNVSATNHQTMLDEGYTDTFSSIYQEEDNCMTWNPKNKLNFHGYFPTSPAQRIDNIFVKSDTATLLKVIEADIMLQEEVMEANGIKMPLSDHYGYFCRILIK